MNMEKMEQIKVVFITIIAQADLVIVMKEGMDIEELEEIFHFFEESQR